VAQVHVPPTAVGPFFVLAFANAPNGLAIERLLLIADPGPLNGLILSAPQLLTTVGQTAAIAVSGVFADGITRNLTGLDRGTTFATTNDAVLGIDPSGLMQARSRGTAQIVVTNTHVVSGVATTAAITVRCELPNPPGNRIPIADAGADQTVAPQTVVTLDGTASADPDGDAIAFRWHQESGRVVILRDVDTATPFFMSPRVTAPAVLEFSLVVTDSKGAATLPKMVRVTVQP
jgi:hypothetical protein